MAREQEGTSEETDIEVEKIRAKFAELQSNMKKLDLILEELSISKKNEVDLILMETNQKLLNYVDLPNKGKSW